MRCAGHMFGDVLLGAAAAHHRLTVPSLLIKSMAPLCCPRRHCMQAAIEELPPGLRPSALDVRRGRDGLLRAAATRSPPAIRSPVRSTRPRRRGLSGGASPSRLPWSCGGLEVSRSCGGGRGWAGPTARSAAGSGRVSGLRDARAALGQGAGICNAAAADCRCCIRSADGCRVLRLPRLMRRWSGPRTARSGRYPRGEIFAPRGGKEGEGAVHTPLRH